MVMQDKGSIEFNPQFLHALHIMEDTKRNVFVTGKAGTGKSTILRFFRDTTEKNVAFLAPTGVAAVNIRGQTIHSFFGFRPDVTLHSIGELKPRHREIYKNLDALVVDEISMVRADLLDCMDIFLRLHGKKKSRPFGGIQMIFIGDLYQLPPVVTSMDKALFRDFYKGPFFFNAMVFQNHFDMEYIELEKIYRQSDTTFVELLNRIRNNTATEEDLALINSRYIPDFQEKGDFYIYLTTTNKLAEEVNQQKLARLKGKEYRYTGFMEGSFTEKDLPTGPELILKEGAQVMLLNNDPLGRWINGSIGIVEEIEKKPDEADSIWIKLEEGTYVEVLPYTWEMYEFYYDRDTDRISSRITGRFTQYPLKLAWAITIHKSQGMTFDRVIIDIGRGTFSHGQLYVALSRCTSLEGLILKRPIKKSHIWMDRRVVEFVTKYQYRKAMDRYSIEDRIAFFKKAIKRGDEVRIVYLKPNDEKSTRTIIPHHVGEMEYRGRKFTGLRAYCKERDAERTFHIERILEMELVEKG